MNSTNELKLSYLSGPSRWDETESLEPNPQKSVFEPSWNILETLIGLDETQIVDFILNIDKNPTFGAFSSMFPISEHTLLNFPSFSERHNNNQYWVLNKPN